MRDVIRNAVVCKVKKRTPKVTRFLLLSVTEARWKGYFCQVHTAQCKTFTQCYKLVLQRQLHFLPAVAYDAINTAI